MKIYLAGPMRNIPLYNFPEFMRMTAILQMRGHIVFNPAQEDIDLDGFNPAKDEPKSKSFYMARDLPEVCECDAIALLRGWEQSECTEIELYVARKLGKKIVDAYTLKEISK